MKKILGLTLVFCSFSVLARPYSTCAGNGGLYNSNSKIYGEFQIDDKNKLINVLFGEMSADYIILKDVRGTNGRTGENHLIGLKKYGSTPYASKGDNYISIWVPNTYYYANTQGSMSFAPKIHPTLDGDIYVGNTVASHVLMDCLE